MDRAIVFIIAMLVVVIPIITGFTYFMYIMFGPQLKEYSTFGDSLTSMLLQSLGNQQTEGIYRSNFIVAVIWTYIYWAFIYFFLITSFMAVFVISYEETVKEQGYP
eukprot:CAMPEP_0202968718 /NCGR_PEP_ID=MMETSP1396-20130829/14130_1 /ASSEMBLY_ACC=CAM_ASM_000872 /TAXON_ID= /ORGANISM="Pseudokeronopsis sp., Strain Brazil" /LENGTH=105 /DNA_ID=CAMNT_0049695353 /DNA_START=73 /DNA_END=390 /DNA_ORIENTATION=-